MGRGPPRLRNLAPLPSDIYLEISQHMDRATLAVFNRASTETRDATRPSLYRHIEVLDTAPLLVRTLGNNFTLSAMVRSLRFSPALRAYPNVAGAEWNQALIAMIHLQHLGVETYVHMDRRIIHLIRFRLTSCSAGYALSQGWNMFLHAQVNLKSLTIYGYSLLLAGELPTTFTHLKHVSATTHQATSFLAIYPLKSVRFLVHLVSPVPLATRTLERFSRLPATVVKLRLLCSHFVPVDAAGPWLLALEELTLDEGEGNWDQRLAGVNSMALQLKVGNVPRLSSLRAGMVLFFDRRGLKSFGVRLQLGHRSRERCLEPIPDDDFRITNYHADERQTASQSKESLPSDPARTGAKTRLERVVDDSLGWDPLCDTLSDWAVEAHKKIPRVTLEYPPDGFAYITDTDGGVYRICTYGIDECRLYMGPESRVRLPDDPQDVQFAEGQTMEDIWTAVVERQAAVDELVRGHAPDGTPGEHFLAIPVRDIMPSLLGGASGHLEDDAVAEMTKGQVWCRGQMVKYDREAYVTFK
ncbi:hypothetical protein C8J57DRAFT_1502997 [Mycena rebaudengoi]|nr:hypothetical protein C8J57DRAFT_1502997 [Mycena rebaudengoi]